MHHHTTEESECYEISEKDKELLIYKYHGMGRDGIEEAKYNSLSLVTQIYKIKGIGFSLVNHVPRELSFISLSVLYLEYHFVRKIDLILCRHKKSKGKEITIEITTACRCRVSKSTI